MLPASPGRGDEARDAAAVARFVERFAGALVETGMPRMPARSFAALLASRDGHLTATELAELLQASPAAISGAVRYLEQVQLVVREREPGSRRDRFVVFQDAWYEASVGRDQQLRRWSDTVADGIVAVGRDTPAGARLHETSEFFAFVADELPRLLDRWRASRKP